MDVLIPAARQATVLAQLDKLSQASTPGRTDEGRRDAALARDLIRLDDMLLVGLDHWPAARAFVAAVLAREGLAGGPA
jgi:hypothetical protein